MFWREAFIAVLALIFGFLFGAGTDFGAQTTVKPSPWQRVKPGPRPAPCPQGDTVNDG